jgi:hypothetical protein
MDKLPWWKSNTLRGLLIAGIALIAQKLGIADTVGDPQASQLVDLALALVESVALGYAAYVRVAQPTPPLSDVAVIRTEARLQKESTQ